MLYIIIALLVVIGILGSMLLKKQHLDTKERNKLQDEVKDLRNLRQYAEEDLKIAKEKREYEEYKLEECKKDLQVALDTYHDITDNKLKEIDASIEEQRNKRQESLDAEIRSQTELANKIKEELEKSVKEAQEWCNSEIAQAVNDAKIKCDEYHLQIESEQEKLSSIQKILKQYDAEQQEKLFYTIQVPEEYKEDIEFLLTTVAAKVQHPDIISKLVWAEYVKPYLDDTFKRIEIKSEPGIYKLTSLQNGKCYVGKSTNVKNRIADHFKSAVGIKSIADQAVHHAILKEGFWNWLIEIITYCDKDKLNEMEKYYIEFFKCQEFGYNKTGGG